jgi:hypothetical protein
MENNNLQPRKTLTKQKCFAQVFTKNNHFEQRPNLFLFIINKFINYLFFVLIHNILEI